MNQDNYRYDLEERFKDTIERLLLRENGSTTVKNIIDSIADGEGFSEEYVNAMKQVPSELYAPYDKNELIDKAERNIRKVYSSVNNTMSTAFGIDMLPYIFMIGMGILGIIGGLAMCIYFTINGAQCI